MKLKIKVKRFKDEEGTPKVNMPKVIKKGDWVDLRAAEKMVFNAPQSGVLKGNPRHRDVTLEVNMIPLGVAMQLPKGFEAPMVARSSLAKKMGLILANGMAVIDNSYAGNEDQWKFPAIPIRKTTIEQNTRICQFRIQLSQKATMWQKLKWLFTSGIEFVEVESLGNENRNGIGEGTGYDD